MILCPLCNGQGSIYEAKIAKSNQIIYICEECDAMWLTSDIKLDKCINFDEFMRSLGLQALWEELTDIRRI